MKWLKHGSNTNLLERLDSAKITEHDSHMTVLTPLSYTTFVVVLTHLARARFMKAESTVPAPYAEDQRRCCGTEAVAIEKNIGRAIANISLAPIQDYYV